MMRHTCPGRPSRSSSLLRALPSALWAVLLALALLVPALGPSMAWAQEVAGPTADPFGGGVDELSEEIRDMPVATSVRILVLLTGLSLLPTMLLVMTPFTRFIIVLSMLRQAMGLQQSPPNQVIIGIALFLSLLVMRPTLDEVVDTSIDPFIAGELETGDAIRAGLKPMRRFMLENTRRNDLAVVMEMGKLARPETLDDIPTPVVVTSFVLSELKTAFIISVKVYLPFLVIDIIVANILLGMGMMVLPPIIISLPFKLLLFVLMDGWSLLLRSLAAGF
jgi:flagellar biosynthetic protein FliP